MAIKLLRKSLTHLISPSAAANVGNTRIPTPATNPAFPRFQDWSGRDAATKVTRSTPRKVQRRNAVRYHGNIRRPSRRKTTIVGDYTLAGRSYAKMSV